MPSHKNYVWIGLILLVFLVSIGLQWKGHGSIAFSDSVHYMVGGVNLISTGKYTSPFGNPELWFPPLYPILIGLLSFGGRIEPMIVGRLISVIASLWCLGLVYLISKRYNSFNNHLPIIAMILLACNSEFQIGANRVLSEAPATALSFTAFFVWESIRSESSWKKYVGLGFIIGLAYLTRPESLILLFFWIVIDWHVYKKVKNFRKYVITIFILFCCMLPYIVYLYHHTGDLQLTNKGDANLKKDQAAFYGGQRQYIDPETLEITFSEFDITIGSETRRYLSNLHRLFFGRGYRKIFHPVFWPILFLEAVIGIICLYKHQQNRLLFGLLAQFIYLVVVCYYRLIPRYLYATFPALAFLMAVGIGETIKLTFPGKDRNILKKAGAVLLLGLVALALLEGGSRLSRWTLTEDLPDVTLLRDVGMRLKTKQLPKGVLYENGTTIVYYSGQLRGRLTQDDLQTIEQHIRHINHPGPVYLAVDSLHSYHPTLKALLSPDSTRFPLIEEIDDHRGKVRVFRVQ